MHLVSGVPGFIDWFLNVYCDFFYTVVMQEYFKLLKTLIAVPSVSGEEDQAAMVIRRFLEARDVEFETSKNNTWARNRFYDRDKPVILLNSHIDTVSPVPGWRVNPFLPFEEGDRIGGLGSNDAGGPLVTLLALFIHFFERDDLPFNLLFAATAEEEISGSAGFESLRDLLPEVTFAIVGEPTKMELAVAERGLLVLDCTAQGKAGHAARGEGINALYLALEDIQKIRNFRFEKVSAMLGEVQSTVTQIQAGVQHNVVPDRCKFVVDVRTNEFYSNWEAYNLFAGLLDSEVKARSFRLSSSGIPLSHPFVAKALALGIPCFGSPTTSDKALMSWPSVKIGPGDSARSHTADEYILKSEMEAGFRLYCRLLEGLKL